MYDKRHADYARQDKRDLAWERVSHEMNESGSRLSSSGAIYEPQFKLSQKNG
jgi:hypothetical protein